MDRTHLDPDGGMRKGSAVMNDNPYPIFQLLTKRSERLAQLRGELTRSQDICMGVSVEDENVTHRINDLRKASAAVRFLFIAILENMGFSADGGKVEWDAREDAAIRFRRMVRG